MKKHLLMVLLCMGMLLTACGMVEVSEERKAKQTEQQQGQSQKDRQEETVQEQQAKAQNQEEQQYSQQWGQEGISVKQQDTHRQLLMIYMVGSDLESETGMASRDIEEILASDFDEENMEVLICTGGTSYWWTKGISADACEVHRVTEGMLQRVHIMENGNMADPNTLTEFMDYGYENVTAEYYSLILWNHGGGAVLGFGADEKHDYDTLSLEEMDEAFHRTKLVEAGKKLEWVGFDACLMSMLEVADMLSDYAGYLVASEEVEAGEGWDYSCLKVISDGDHTEGRSATEEIVNAYRNYYEANYKYTPDYTLACMDLSCTSNVVAELENLIAVAEQELRNGGYSRIARMRDQAKTFGKVSSEGFYDTVDLYDLAEKMMENYPNQAEGLQKALEEMIVHKAVNVRGAHGLSVYFPYENKEYAQEWMEEYETIGFSEEYVTFLKEFSNTLSGEQLTKWNIAEVAPVESHEVAGEYYVQLSEEQYVNFSSAKYSIWQEESPGSYICWISSRDVTVSDDGKISSGFQGKRFYLGDTSGASLPCCVSEIERNDKYVKYGIPIIWMSNEQEEFAVQAAFIHFKVDVIHPEGVIVGIYKTLNADSSLFPNRDVVEIEDGDIISPFYFAREIGFREDGSVSPFEEWKVTSGAAESFTISGEFTITLGDMDEEEYCCLFQVMDTQGNAYFTNPVYIQ